MSNKRGWCRLSMSWASAWLAALMLMSANPVLAQQGSKTVRPKPPAAPAKKTPPTEAAAAPTVPLVLTPGQLAVAAVVQVGSLPCELGQTVELAPVAGVAGHFHLRLGKDRYTVTPEETTTGAVRLEDKQARVVWLQLSNKSMLMNQKLGRRMADECKSAAQELVAQDMLRNPLPSLLDKPVPVASAPAPTLPASAPTPPVVVSVPPLAPVAGAPLPPMPVASASAASRAAPATTH